MKSKQSIGLFLLLAVFLFGGVVGGNAQGDPPTNLKRANKKEAARRPACDFQVKLSEPDFHVIRGRVHDIHVTLLPITGVCSGSAILNVSGLPSGATKKIFPSSKLKFKKGIAVATVRINTSGVDLKEGIATSSLTLSASRKGKTRTAKANMTVDLPSKEQVVQGSACDFEVKLTEPDFCVIQGSVYDMDVTLLPIAGVCNGPATLNVSGLPLGATKEILPSPKIRFEDGIATATVRVDTAGVDMKKGMATSTLTVSASKRGLIRTAKADMIVDLPDFYFTLKPRPTVVTLHQEDATSTDVMVEVKLRGAACQIANPVTLSLDTASLPAIITHEFSSTVVTPPGETTISFKAKSGEEIGTFKATLIGIGCCTIDGENIKKTAEISMDVTFPHIPDDMEEDGQKSPKIEKKFKAESMENMFKTFNLSPEAQEATRKAQKDLSEKGYIETSESGVEGLRYAKTLARPIDQAAYDLLSFKPAALENTPFKGFRPEGGFYYNEVGGKSTALNRIFTMPDGALVMLTELDYRTSGGGSVYPKEFINENINGSSARLGTYQSPSGKAITSMLWETAAMAYTLEMEGAVKKNGKYILFLNLAMSIQ